jgi:hypothetical protein
LTKDDRRRQETTNLRLISIVYIFRKVFKRLLLYAYYRKG